MKTFDRNYTKIEVNQMLISLRMANNEGKQQNAHMHKYKKSRPTCDVTRFHNNSIRAGNPTSYCGVGKDDLKEGGGVGGVGERGNTQIFSKIESKTIISALLSLSLPIRIDNRNE